MRNVLVFIIMLISLAACAGEPTPSGGEVPVEIAQDDATATGTPIIPPTPTSRLSTVSPERMTELPTLRDLASIPTFTPTFTPTITLTPTMTHTPTPTVTPTPLRPEDYCDILAATTQRPAGTIYRDNPVLFQFFIPRTDVIIRFTLMHEESEEPLGSAAMPGGEVVAGAFRPENLPYSGRYDWTATIINADGDELCSEGSYFFVEKPEATADPEAAAEVTLEVTVEVTPEATAEATEENEG